MSVEDKNKTWISRKQRHYLKDVLPLDSPYSVQVEPTRNCNFRCIYCSYSKGGNGRHETLSLEAYSKFIDGLLRFNKKLTSLTYSGLGEPLLHKDLPYMIKLAKTVADEVCVISNGSLLTEKLYYALCESGLDILRISLQGLSDKEYKDTCGVNFSFNKFVSLLGKIHTTVLTEDRTKIFIKAVDLTVNTQEKKDKLYEIFIPISDSVEIQAISPISNKVNNNAIKNNMTKTLYGEDVSGVSVCPQPFFHLFLSADANIHPCHSINENIPVLGNAMTDSVIDIWNGKRLYEFRCLQLRKERFNHNECKICNYPVYLNNVYDNIDDSAQHLLKLYASVQ